MKLHRSAGILSLSILMGVGFSGCKAAGTAEVGTAPTLTFTEAANASLQAAHKFGADIDTSVRSGALSLTPAEKRVFNAFVTSLNATDVLFIAYVKGTATQAQVTRSLAHTASLQTAAQTALAGGN